MSDIPPLSGKVGLDTTEFKSALSEMNREIRVIESAFRASVGGLEDWASSASGVEQRIEALNEKIEVQTRKVQALREQYERVASEQGKDSRAAQELLIKYNDQVTALGKMQVELGQSERKLGELRGASTDAGEGLDKLEHEGHGARDALEKLRGVANGLKTALAVGVGAVAGLATAVAGVGLAVGKLVTDASEAAGELVDLSLKTGIGTEKLQEMAYVGEQVGTDVDTMTSSLARMTRAMSDVGSSKEITAAFERLGVSAKDSNGELRNSQVVFGELIDALGGVSNETERDALAMEIFGRSAMELNPLIKAGADEIRRLSDEAHNVGAVMSEESVAGLEELGDGLAGLKMGLQGTMGELAAAFLPGATELVSTAQDYLGQFGEIVRGADGDLVKMAEGVGDLVGKIVTDIAERGPEMLQAGLNIVQGILAAITQNLPKLLDGAVEIIRSLVKFIVDNLPMVIDTGLQIILTLVDALVENLPMIVEAGIRALVALMEGLAEAMPKLIPAIVEAILLIVEVLIENLPMLVEAGGKLLLGIVQGLAEALPILIEKAPELIRGLAEALIALLPILAEVGLEMLKIIGKAIVDNLPLMGQAALEIGRVINESIRSLGQTLWETGKAIIDGIWQGIQDNAAQFMEQVKGFFRDLIDAAKAALGIRSPSKAFALIGANAGRSYIDSLGAALTDGTKGLQSAFGRTALTLAGAPGGQGATTNNYYNLTANYPMQSQTGVVERLRLMQMLHGET